MGQRRQSIDACEYEDMFRFFGPESGDMLPLQFFCIFFYSDMIPPPCFDECEDATIEMAAAVGECCELFPFDEIGE